MCGIAGIIGLKNSRQAVENMLTVMHHRGPDDWGVFEDDTTVLGHKRLSIIDLSAAGHQPMTNAKGDCTIVFNGEIYNFNELKSLLPKQTILKSTSDTEVVLELWSLLGNNLFAKLRGMFAIAIWNAETQELVLARDHMGIKPLYYQHHNNTLVFASELKGMLASECVDKKINQQALVQYLANGYVMQPDTFIESVKMLPPASYLVWNGKESIIQSFWNLTDQPDKQPSSEEEAIADVKQLIIDSVKEETIADRPLGVFLSGGLDSTILVAALKESGINHINTFSVGFDGDDLSEEYDAKETAEFYQTQHTQLQVSEKDIAPHIDQYIKALDQPSVDGLNTWLVSKVTAQHVTVALSGLGGDELFSGYSIDRSIIYKQKYSTISKLLFKTKNIWKAAPAELSRKLHAYASWKDLPSFYQTWGRVFSESEITKLTKDNTYIQNQYSAISISSTYSLLQRITFMHLRGFMMSRLLRDSDAVSMYHSLEVRFPLIDYRLAELAFHLPDPWKLKFVKETAFLSNYEKENSYERNGVKHILYQAFKKNLPPTFGLRPKRGFKMPIEKWMRSGLWADIEQTLLKKDTYLNQTQIRQLVNTWKNKEEHWIKVWSLYIFEKWVRQHIK